MQRSYVAAILMAACGIMMSSCDLIFGSKQKPVIDHSLIGNWIALSDSTQLDSIFKQPVSDSSGTVQLVFRADSILTATQGDSVIFKIPYYQNVAGDTLFVKQDSMLNSYPVVWNSDSTVSLQQTNQLLTLTRQ